jgi:hypothetical protein
MRKKKHFKINSKDTAYDRFYMINYLEPGKDWKALEKEKDDDEDTASMGTMTSASESEVDETYVVPPFFLGPNEVVVCVPASHVRVSFRAQLGRLGGGRAERHGLPLLRPRPLVASDLYGPHGQRARL